MRITPDKGDALRFQLNVHGANFHVCDLSGVIRNGASRMEDISDDNLPCIVNFKMQKDGIAVASQHQGTCSTYCGARAHFEGGYKLPSAGCEPSQVRQTRNRFKAAYDKNQLAEARTMLARATRSGLANCLKVPVKRIGKRSIIARTRIEAGGSMTQRGNITVEGVREQRVE